jgi:hypothetical protein
MAPVPTGWEPNHYLFKLSASTAYLHSSGVMLAFLLVDHIRAQGRRAFNVLIHIAVRHSHRHSSRNPSTDLGRLLIKMNQKSSIIISYHASLLDKCLSNFREVFNHGDF